MLQPWLAMILSCGCVKNCGFKVERCIGLELVYSCAGSGRSFSYLEWNVQLEELIQKDTLKMGRSSSSISEIKVF